MQKRYPTFGKHTTKLSEDTYYDFSKKEIVIAFIVIIIGAFISFIPVIPTDNIQEILAGLIIFAIIIAVNFTAKKLAAQRYSIRIEHKFWEIYRFGFYEGYHFKKPIPLGVILPFFFAILSLGYIKPFTFFQFEAVDVPNKRIVKQVGWKKALRKDYMGDYDLAYTSAWGFYALLGVAVIATAVYKFLDFSYSHDLLKYSVFYGFWNLLPLGQLDGSKVFFGAFLLWIFLIFLYTIFFVMVFLI